VNFVSDEDETAEGFDREASLNENERHLRAKSREVLPECGPRLRSTLINIEASPFLLRLLWELPLPPLLFRLVAGREER
jgi:hypothetical protein